jgi:hypothetical protein
MKKTVLRRLDDGIKRRARLHQPHRRTHHSGLVLLWLAHAVGRPSENYPPDGDMVV